MSFSFPLFPPTASTYASQVDALYLFLIIVSGVMTLLIFFFVFFFAVRYRKVSDELPKPIHGSMRLELAWSIIPLLIMLVMFFWGAQLYYAGNVPPRDAAEIFVVGKQWMWKIQHADGQSEINELHVPVGQPVKVTMTTEDVIHSFFIPAFRVKRDVIPGHYSTIWFTPTKPGRYHLFCAEYCGTQHSGMVGWVNVMEMREYQRWASGGGAEGSVSSQGEKLFQQLGCATCHVLEQQGRCPILKNLYGKPVQLQDGRTVIADDAYLRESILNPNAKITSGFQPDTMPVFQGQIDEEGVIKLIAYIKSLGSQGTPTVGQPSPGSGAVSPASTTKTPSNAASQEGK